MSALRGAEGFDVHHSSFYGSRWPVLKAALLSEGEKFQLENPFWQSDQTREKFYLLDPASVVAAEALPLAQGGHFLDLCAAPGGKALVEIYRSRGEMTYVLNDSSRDRVKRLKGVMHDYLPGEIINRVHFSNHTGERWGLYEQNVYDAVLVDAPCSGERHLLQTPSEMKIWSMNRSKGLAQRQFALLCAALEAVKVGGYILYSTCSIESCENDLVVKKLRERRSGRVVVCARSKCESHFGIRIVGEPTEYGSLILPDREGFGPIYYSLLQRSA